ncbi:MAG: hypothetical protein J6S56_05920, partial [Bacteroidales bacterium]|nr:hypothetical protein [Bacteroidales bacterium]
MRKKYWVFLLFFIFIFFQVADIQAQKYEKKFSFSWKSPVTHTFSEERSVSFMTFEDAVYLQDNPYLPAVYEMIPMPDFYESYEVTVSHAEYEAVSAAESSLIPDDFHQKKISVKTISANERKRPYLLLSFVPIIETAPGQYSRLKSV